MSKRKTGPLAYLYLLEAVNPMEYSRVCHDYVVDPGVNYRPAQQQVHTYHPVESTVIRTRPASFHVAQPYQAAARPVSYQPLTVYQQPVHSNVQYVWSQQPAQPYTWIEHDGRSHYPAEMPNAKRFCHGDKNVRRERVVECKKKIGMYTRAERNRRLEKYRQRRRERNYDAKKVRYEIRKTISQRRARSKGRFTKRSEQTHEKDGGESSE